MAEERNEYGAVFLSWEAPEYEYYEKGSDWYWWVGLVAVGFIAVALWQQSFLFALLVVLSWFTVVLYAVRPPRNVSVGVYERGIVVDQTLYAWGSIESFWIFYNPPRRKDLSLVLKKSFTPPFKIHLGSQDPVALRTTLIRFVSEKEQEESLIDNLSRLAKF